MKPVTERALNQILVALERLDRVQLLRIQCKIEMLLGKGTPQGEADRDDPTVVGPRDPGVV